VRLVGGEPGTIDLEVVNLSLQHGDYLVVATDGVWGRVSLDRVRELVSGARNPEHAEGAIVTEVALREFETSRSDNRGLIVYQHGVLASTDHPYA
jgi:serine/threonine protein phosphatase PrpC